MDTKQTKLESRFLNFEEARYFLGNVPKGTLREWTAKGRIRSFKRGKRLYYWQSDLYEFMLKDQE